MKIVPIKDNSKKKKEAFSDIMNLTVKIADKTLEQLEREGIFVFPEMLKDAEDVTRDQIILQSQNDDYCTGNVMGFLGYGEERLVIRSRFSQDDSEDYFFQYLLDRVLDFPNIVDLKSDADPNSRLYSFLLFLFPFYLKKAVRKGVFKEYIRRQYNDDNVKGIIDIPRHIDKNIPFVGNIAYSQREFSFDNHLTELIRHTIEYIKKKSYGNTLLVKAKEEVKQIIDATPSYELYNRQKIIEENKKNVVRHAYFREYRELQHLCLLILQHQKHQVGSGIREIYGILFDGAWLWEEYVNTLIGRDFYHPMNKSKKYAQSLFFRNRGIIYPDFIGKIETQRVIADAKYKPNKNIRGEDYLQVLAYMYRFDSKEGYYLYPESENEKDLRLWLKKGTTFEGNEIPRDDISVIKHGLRIPVKAINYETFVEQMKENERDFISIFDDK